MGSHLEEVDQDDEVLVTVGCCGLCQVLK